MDDKGEAISSVLDRNAGDARERERELRELMRQDRTRFLRGAAQVLASADSTPEWESLAVFLAQSEGIIEDLCNPELFEDRTVLFGLARSIAKAEPSMDTRLLRMLPTRDSGADAVAATEQILALLEAVPQSQES